MLAAALSFFNITRRRRPRCRRAAHALGAAQQRSSFFGWALLLALSVFMQAQAWDADRMLGAAARLGPAAVRSAQALQALLASLLATDGEARLRVVNEFFNRRVMFENDSVVWGQNDHWASPLEMLAKGQGDCEDYAIAKYLTLLAAGMPSQQLRLVYVRAMLGGPDGVAQAHMVLAYYERADAEPLILDNLINDIRPASRRPDLTPVFSFNADGMWQGTASTPAGDPVARLSRWRDVLAKARQEGLL
jgi:predicted transglutaminase-like cysteine proteinase